MKIPTQKIECITDIHVNILLKKHAFESNLLMPDWQGPIFC